MPVDTSRLAQNVHSYGVFPMRVLAILDDVDFDSVHYDDYLNGWGHRQFATMTANINMVFEVPGGLQWFTDLDLNKALAPAYMLYSKEEFAVLFLETQTLGKYLRYKNIQCISL